MTTMSSYLQQLATRRDQAGHYTLAAFAHLSSAQDARERYDQILRDAIDRYGDRHMPTWRSLVGGRPSDGCSECRERGLPPNTNHQTGGVVAGVYADHFPDTIKARLRAYACEISQQVAFAFTCWRKAGRKRISLRPVMDQARYLSDGRVSHY
jgi:hypothetical protein